MTTPYPRAHVMRNAIITSGGTTYTNQCTKARLVPDTPIVTQRTLVPSGTIVDTDSTVWTLELSGVQDRGAGSLGALFDSSAGQSLELTIQPKAGTGQDVATCTVVPIPMEFGGEQGKLRTFDLALPVVGDPVFTQSAGA